MDLTVGNQGCNNSSNMVSREYRKGNWNLQETMVLIEAKKMDDERRTMRRVGEMMSSSSSISTHDQRGKPAELRWKWVEDYCWKNGCLRSQNQCNDKWDNLMRDFKKVREYEKRLLILMAAAPPEDHEKSYWRIDKNQRKDNNLPSNMLPQIYEALVEVVERKGHRVAPAIGAAGFSSDVSLPPPPPVVEKITTTAASTGPVLLGHHHPFMSSNIVQVPATMVAPPPAAEPPSGTAIPSYQPLPTVDSDTSEYSGSPAKRRKRRDGGGGGGEGTSGGGGTIQELGSAITKSASTIAEAIQSCEEREERRHREVLSVHERRLQIEESKAEINKQGINGLVDAINKLAHSIFALAAHNNQSPSK